MKIKLNGLQKFYLTMVLLIFVLTSPFIFATYGNDIVEHVGPYRHAVTGTVGLEYFVSYILIYVIFIVAVLVLCSEEDGEGKNKKMECTNKK